MFKTVDLFAGIGGMRLGFEEAGFEAVYANDNNPKCKVTYDLNFPTTPLTLKDITKLSTDGHSSVLNDIKAIDYDVLLGGFPCQPFSQAGRREGFKDAQGRGELFFYIAEIIEATQPQAFLLENVKNLYTHDKGNTYKVIKETLMALGYSLATKVMDTSKYTDIPQSRHRVFIAGFKSPYACEAFEFPDPVDVMLTFSQILTHPDLVGNYYYYADKPLWDRIKDYPFEKNVAYQWRRKYIRENKSGLFPTLTANMGTGGHNVTIVRDGRGVRRLTPRECFRLQGFPDTYKFPDIARSHLYTQAGNSVTVSLVKRIAEKMRDSLKSP